MRSRLTILAISLLLGAASQLQAQRLDPPGTSVPIRPFAISLRPRAFTVSARPMDVQDGDHRWEGAAIGGVLGGIIGLSVRGSQCDDPETPTKETCTKSTVRWGLIGAALGAVAGGLIGSQIDK